jgi:hypothetical protein
VILIIYATGQIKMLHTIKFSPTYNYFLPVRSKYQLDDEVLEDARG